MSQITKESIIFAKKNNKVLLCPNFWEQVPSWSDVFDIFKLANKKNSVHFNSFGTCTIDKSEQYSDIFDNFIDKLSLIHPGKKIAVFSIIHFITKHDNTIKDEIAKIFKEDFIFSIQLNYKDLLRNKIFYDSLIIKLLKLWEQPFN